MHSESHDWRGRSCLVTGAGGFIGGALCRRLSDLGAHVWSSGRTQDPPHGWGRWIVCDVTDPEQVRDAFTTSAPEFVFHLASRVTGARDLGVVLPTLNANLIGLTHVALQAAQRGCKRMICMGSLQEPDEALPAIPTSPYAAAKFAASCYARMFVSVFGVPITIARPMMVYGPGQTDLTKLVPYVASELIRGNRAKLSSGRQEFDWVFVDDVCEALLRIATTPELEGRTIDIGTGTLTSVAHVARRLADRLDASSSLDTGVLADRTGEPTRAANTAETEALTGWRSRVDLEQGLSRTVSWFETWLEDGTSGTRIE